MGHEAHIRGHARTSKQKMDLDYGRHGYDFRNLIMATNLKHDLNYGSNLLIIFYRPKSCKI